MKNLGREHGIKLKINNQDTFITNPNKNDQVESGYDQLNLTGKLRYQPTQNINLIYTAQYANTTDLPRYDRLPEERANAPRYAEWYYGPQLWFNTNLAANFDIRNDAWDKVRITVGYQKFKESRNDRKYKSTLLRSRSEEVNAYNLNVDFDKKIGKKHTFFYGVEGIYNDVTSTGKLNGHFQ